MLRLADLNPLKFSSSDDERAFFQIYCLDQLPLIRFSVLLAGVMLYVFFIWDRTVDSSNWQTTQVIRGSVLTPWIWGMAGLLLIPKLQKYLELIMLLGIIVAISILLYICVLLNHAFDYAESGYIIVLFFMITLLPARLPYYLTVFVLSLAMANIAQIYAGGYKEGMLLINNLYGSSAIILATFSVVFREKSARKQFKDRKALENAQREVNALLETYIPPDELRLLKERRLRSSGQDVRIAISYRRTDSDAIAGRIRDRLAIHFGAGSVFMDIDNIPYGRDFRSHIDDVLKKTDIVLAIVGPKWAAFEGGKARIADPADPVRIEIETAMALGVSVLPVLVGGATMPTDLDLPESLVGFAFRNAAEVQSGRDFGHHMERLIRAVDDTTVVRH